jgi:hypothetical protein
MSKIKHSVGHLRNGVVPQGSVPFQEGAELLLRIYAPALALDGNAAHTVLYQAKGRLKAAYRVIFSVMKALCPGSGSA